MMLLSTRTGRRVRPIRPTTVRPNLAGRANVGRRAVVSIICILTTASMVLLLNSPVAIAGPRKQLEYLSLPNTCTNNQVCFWYGAGFGSANRGFSSGNIPDLLNPTRLFSCGYGYYYGCGAPVGNNSESTANYWYDHVAYIFYSKNFTGQYLYVGPRRGYSDMGPLNNDNRSFRISE